MSTWGNQLALFIAEFGFSGRSPVAPGTVGSIASLLIWLPLIYINIFPIFFIGVLILLFFLGVWVSPTAINYYQQPDPPQVVIDEVVGQGLVLFFANPNLWEVFTCVILFRFFDILKPWPIKQSEEYFSPAWAIMIDDILAGVFAVIIFLLIKYFTGLY